MTARYQRAPAEAIACPFCPGLWLPLGLVLEMGGDRPGWTRGWSVYQCDRCRTRWAPAVYLLEFGARQAAARLLLRGQR